MHIKVNQRGDTLIEVMIVLAVLGALVTIAYSVMNRNFGTMQNSLDRTNVQALVTGQASMLRAAHALALKADTAYWNDIKARVPESTPGAYISGVSEDMDTSACDSSLRYTPPAAKPEFFFDVRDEPLRARDAASIVNTDGAAAPGNGIWIEGHTYEDAKKKDQYVFYLKACWQSSYVQGPNNEYVTVVKLYDPTE